MPEEQPKLTPEQERDQTIGRLLHTANFFKGALAGIPLTISPARQIVFTEISSVERVPETETIIEKNKEVEAEVIDPETGQARILHELHMKNGDILVLDDKVNPDFPDIPSELDIFLPVWDAHERIASVNYFRTIMELDAMIPEDAPPESPVQDMGDGGN